MRIEFFLCISVLRVASGPRMKLASCKSALNPLVVYSTDRSKALVPVLVLLFCCFVVHFTRRFVLSLALWYFVLVFSSPFSIAITSHGEERELVLVLFVRLFDLRLFGFVCFLFLLVSGKSYGLWLWHSITKTYLYNYDPLKPHFYIVKLGLTGVYIIFLISAQKHRLWVLVRTAPPRRF